MRKINLLITVFLALAAFVAVFVWLSKAQPKQPVVKNFEECAKAGYPIMESYPRQCSAPSGKFFVEEKILER